MIPPTPTLITFPSSAVSSRSLLAGAVRGPLDEKLVHDAEVPGLLGAEPRVALQTY